jgi:hypothetical protein
MRSTGDMIPSSRCGNTTQSTMAGPTLPSILRSRRTAASGWGVTGTAPHRGRRHRTHSDAFPAATWHAAVPQYDVGKDLPGQFHQLRFAATPLDNLTNARFADIVTANFGPTPQQHARLYSSKEAGARSFLQPLSSAGLSGQSGRVHAHGQAQETPASVRYPYRAACAGARARHALAPGARVASSSPGCRMMLWRMR